MKNREALYLIGRPFSPLYSILMRIRESLYRKRILSVTTLQVPVVSVGNLTMGGTGKTPIVHYIARLLQKKGWKPAVISRGYGGKSKEKINIVSEGAVPLLEASYVGDEPRLLAESLPGVPVLTGAIRKLPALRAVEMGADVLVLDDGFQHMSLGRNLDLVLFNADSLAGNSRVFPGGDLREPVKALSRADAFIITGTSTRNMERAKQFAALLSQRFPGQPVFLGGYAPTGVYRHSVHAHPEKIEPALLGEHSFFAFSGIARPDGFEQTLRDLNVSVAFFHPLPDHFGYTPQAVRNLEAIARQNEADALIVTEKDMVKLRGLETELPLFSVSMEADMDQSFDNFLLDYLTPLQLDMQDQKSR